MSYLFKTMKTITFTSLLLLTFTSFAQVQPSIVPLFTYGNYQRFDEVINLTPSAPDAIEYNNDSIEGYDLLSTKKIYVSLGAQAVSSVQLDHNTFGYIGVGLYPSYNSYAKQSRHFNNKENLNQFSFNIPTSSEDLNDLQTGDAVYWNSQGGITLHVSVGIGVLGLGPKVSVEGGHSVYVEKKSDTEVYVELRRLSTKSWGIVQGALVAYAEIGKILERSQGLSFLIDVSSAEGQDIYEQLMKRGRVDLLQESSAAHVKVGDVQSLKVLSSLKAAVAVPFIPVLELKGERGTELLTEERSYNRSSNDSELVRALSFKISSTRVFNKQTSMETAALVQDETKSSVQTTKSQLHWFRKGNRYKVHRLEHALEKLKVKTGMSEELSVNFPTGRKNLGFAKIEFILDLSPSLQSALFKKSGLTQTKSKASYLQNFWKNSSRFQTLLKYVKQCGGQWSLEISGKNINRVLKKAEYPAATCKL